MLNWRLNKEAEGRQMTTDDARGEVGCGGWWEGLTDWGSRNTHTHTHTHTDTESGDVDDAIGGVGDRV